MRIFSSYSRRKDAQTAKRFKVFGPGDFFKSPQEKINKLALNTCIGNACHKVFLNEHVHYKDRCQTKECTEHLKLDIFITCVVLDKRYIEYRSRIQECMIQSKRHQNGIICRYSHYILCRFEQVIPMPNDRQYSANEDSR